MATMDVERWFFDTNVLIYATDSTAPLHQTAVTLLHTVADAQLWARAMRPYTLHRGRDDVR